MTATNLFLDPTTNDLVIGPDFNLRFTVDNSELVSQKITNRLQTFRGEWYLNRDLGIPYYSDVFRKNPNLPQIRSILLAAVKGVNGVEEIIRFDTELDSGTRQLNVDFTVRITTGEIITGEVEL